MFASIFFLINIVFSVTKRNLYYMPINTAHYGRADRSKTGYCVCQWRIQAAFERSEFAAPSSVNVVRLSPFWAADFSFLVLFLFDRAKRKKYRGECRDPSLPIRRHEKEWIEEGIGKRPSVLTAPKEKRIEESAETLLCLFIGTKKNKHKTIYVHIQFTKCNITTLLK